MAGGGWETWPPAKVRAHPSSSSLCSPKSTNTPSKNPRLLAEHGMNTLSTPGMEKDSAGCWSLCGLGSYLRKHFQIIVIIFIIIIHILFYKYFFFWPHEGLFICHFKGLFLTPQCPLWEHSAVFDRTGCGSQMVAN